MILLVAMGIIFSQWLSRYHEQIAWLMKLTGSIVGGLMAIFSSDVTYIGSSVSFKGFVVEIIDECTGLFEMVIYLAAVLAYSTTFKKKLLGISFGLPAIFIFNLIRIIALLLAGASSQKLFDFMHLYFWQVTLIIMIAVTWVGWLYLVVYSEKKSHTVSS